MDHFTITDYGRKAPFSSFLPGISGLKGIPLWCYYVNRGQAVASFGFQDKDHSIMEFSPAHQAYQNVKRTGFRTFLKKDGRFYEPFARETASQQMEIFPNRLVLKETSQDFALETKVLYYTLPQEPCGALVRRVTVTNTGEETCHLEILDGLPALVPCGVSLENLKNMCQTAKAWMQAEDTRKGLAFFRVRASMEDSSVVKQISDGNFSLGFDEDRNLLTPLADPELIFGYDTSLETPVGFLDKGLDELLQSAHDVQNQFPCCFFGVKKTLAPGESAVLSELTGYAPDKAAMHLLARKISGQPSFFQEKESMADALTETLTRGISCRTASEVFDSYCRQSLLDNLLRGGYPLRLPGGKVFYAYSRKHGDLERDYNYFSMLPQYYSQGNGNFRDVNQNRRCDVFFHPWIGTENIRLFYSLIQPDGYNPLKIEMTAYVLPPEAARALKSRLSWLPRKFLEEAFTPGELLACCEEQFSQKQAESLFEEILAESESRIRASFGEGCWSDHWTYNLDLVENYLSIYPEKEESILYESSLPWFLPARRVNPRARRYVRTPGGLRQYHFLEEPDDTPDGAFVTAPDGTLFCSTLMEKLLLLSAVKYATLDPYGCGVEMEGGKPGWYDALNGLPALFGSSLAESCELARNLEFTIRALKAFPRELELFEELADLIGSLSLITDEEWEALCGPGEVLRFWNRINDAKEDYRKKIYRGVSGKKRGISSQALVPILEKWYAAVRMGISKAAVLTGEFCPTYLSFEVTDFKESAEGIRPLHFRPVPVPLFLEGPVRRMKLADPPQFRQNLYRQVRLSGLYDRKLSMYKVNASLQDASYELGRARAFTPGWLENESIWLHMEYKYLLELLKSGMYPEFFQDFQKTAVPFQNPEVYGRSILENSSFIASSANPDPKLWGRGFVARLSGSTAELLQMWGLIFFGPEPFCYEPAEDGAGKELLFTPKPAIPAWLIPESNVVETTLFSEIPVAYHLNQTADFFPGGYEITNILLTDADGNTFDCPGRQVRQEQALAIREQKIRRIDIFIHLRPETAGKAESL